MAEHETDVASLVFGLLFVGLAGVWALVQYDVLTLPAASVVAPIVLVVAGTAGLLLTLRRSMRPGARRGSGEHDPAELTSDRGGRGGSTPTIP